MPVPDRYVSLFAQVIETDELVIDQSLQGSNIQAAYGSGRVLGKLRKDREEGSFRLAGSRGCAQKDILVAVEDRISRGDLDRTQILPAAAVDKVLYKVRITGKDIHGTLLYGYRMKSAYSSSMISSLTASLFA